MRVNRFVGVSQVAPLAVVAAMAACSSSSGGGPAADAGSTVVPDAGDAGGTPAVDGGGDDGGEAGTAGPTCALKAECTVADKTCVGLVDNSGMTKFGLRMTELDLTAPSALSGGTLAGTLGGAVSLPLASCNQMGTGTFSWLFQFDTTAMTLKTGGAKPVADPTLGFAFDDETIMEENPVHVQPVTYSNVAVDASGHFAATAGQDLVMPVFLSATGAASAILLPMHQVSFTMGTLSASRNCIGTYNAAKLDPANGCLPDSTASPPVTAFVDGASFSGYITLEEADAIAVTQLQETLCVLLSGDPTTYGQTTGAMTSCKRDAGNAIVYQGHWCAAANGAANASCADAEQIAGSFAAGSVLITN